MDVAALEDIRQHVAHLFADAQRADRFFLGVFVHLFPLPTEYQVVHAPGMDENSGGAVHLMLEGPARRSRVGG
jgi:hypothetical protein